MINFLVFAKTGKGFLIRRAFVSLLAAVLWKISTVNYNARVIDLATLTIIGLLKIFRRGRFGTKQMHKTNARRFAQATALVGRAIGTPCAKAVSRSVNAEIGRAGPVKICVFDLNTVH
ncbi:hypothetical protein A35_05120 [Coxiella burnetii 'MSU Goat Q177']|nr:hypothetical protein A35_05120 [Coxiella burnetii 'MSU Goat Q177']